MLLCDVVLAVCFELLSKPAIEHKYKMIFWLTRVGSERNVSSTYQRYTRNIQRYSIIDRVYFDGTEQPQSKTISP